MHKGENRIVALVGGAIILLLIVLIIYRVTTYEPKYEEIILNDGWDVTLHDRTEADADITKLHEIFGEKISRGDCVSIRCDLPVPEGEILAPTLMLDTRYAAVEVFFNGEKILSEDMDHLGTKRFISSQYHFVALPDDYEGGELRADLYFGEDNANYDIAPPRIGNAEDLVKGFIERYRYPLFSGIFLFMFGAFFLVVSLLFSVMLPEIMGQRVSAIISFTFGIWILTTYRFICLFMTSSEVSTADYVAYFQFVPLFYLLFPRIHEVEHPRLYKVLAISGTVVSEGLVLLHFLNIVHITQWRLLYYAVAGVMMGMYIFYDYLDIRRGNTGILNVLQMLGPTFFCVCGFIAMLIYLANGFFTGAMAPDSSLAVFTTGCMGFALTRFIIYLVLLMETSGYRLEFESLSRIANAEPLTGLFNRHYLTDMFDMYDRGRKDFCIVSLDLNDLKYVNDTFGHGKGDQLLMNFADVLRESFPRSASCCRVGGDEFVVLIEGRSEEQTKGYIAKMTDAFARLDETQPMIPHSAAAGYAFRHENPTASAHDIYMIADQRMYENKREIKEKRGDIFMTSVETFAPSVNVERDFREKEFAELDTEERRRLDSMFTALTVTADTTGVFLCNMKHDYSRWSKSIVDAFGLPGEYMFGAGELWEAHLHPDDRALYHSNLENLFNGTFSEHNMQYRALNNDGKYVVCTCRGTVIKDADGNPEYFCGTIRDYGSESHIDPVSGLRNQYGFSDDVTELLHTRSAARILLIGISGFGEINDLYGYEYGSRVLEMFGHLILECVGNSGFVYRMDGARFAVVGRGYSQEETEKIYRMIQLRGREDFFVDGRRQTLITCGGMLSIDNFRVNVLTVTSCLSFALKESSNRLHGDLYVFSSEMTDENRRTLEMVNVIRSSIVDDFRGFFLCYQYLVDAQSGEISGAEALLRWKDDYYGVVPPGQFVNIIEQDPLFPDLGTWIMRQAMTDGMRFLEKYPDFVMNVNLSYSQLEKFDFTDVVVNALQDTGFPADHLCLEVTESCRVLDIELLKNIIAALRMKGVRFALDDFGTGFSSLSILRRLPFDVVKVDREFVMDIESSEESRRTIKAVSELAQVFNVAVCIEGVETEGMRDILRQYSIKTFQGFLYARPQPMEELMP